MKICLVVRVVSRDDETIGAYAREVELPFVPTVGMEFKQGSSTWLWETESGQLHPTVKRVVYNFDEETVYCLFEITEYLKSSFWTEINSEILNHNFELRQFGY